MKLKPRKPSGREKNHASEELLNKMRQQLHSGNLSRARRTAHILSWMQEDGLEILTEALFENTERKTKVAAAYGLRKTQGRMKEKALKVFHKGLKHKDNKTKSVCERALARLQSPKNGGTSRSQSFENKIEIKEIHERKERKSKKTQRLPYKK